MAENEYHVHETSGRGATIKARKGCDNSNSVIIVGGVCLSPSIFARVVECLINDGHLKIASRRVSRVVYEDVLTVVDPFS